MTTNSFIGSRSKVKNAPAAASASAHGGAAGGDITNELEARFGVQLKSGGGVTGSSSGAEKRRSGHVVTTALLPKPGGGGTPAGMTPVLALRGGTPPTNRGPVAPRVARGPVAAHFNSKANNSGAGDATVSNGDSRNHSNGATTDSTSTGDTDDTETVLYKAHVVYDFTQAEEGEVCVMAGQIVHVIKDNENGWSFIRTRQYVKGWCPANYLLRLEGDLGDSDGEHDYQNEEFPLGIPPASQGGKVSSGGRTGSGPPPPPVKPKVDLSSLGGVKLKSTTPDSPSAKIKPSLPEKPPKGVVKGPGATTKPAPPASKPQIAVKPGLSPKPSSGGTAAGGGTTTGGSTAGAGKAAGAESQANNSCSVQKLAKVFDQK